VKPLLQRIEPGEIDPTRIITHTLQLDEAERGFELSVMVEGRRAAQCRDAIGLQTPRTATRMSISPIGTSAARRSELAFQPSG
jgi:hypothetical protein